MNPSTTTTLSTVSPGVIIVCVIIALVIFAKADNWFRWLMVIVFIVLCIVFATQAHVHG